MKHFILLLIVALLAIAVLLFIFNPELLEEIWLWIVGLIGVIISAIRNLIDGIKNLFKSDSNKKAEAPHDVSNEKQVPSQASEVTTQQKNELSNAQTRIQNLETEVSLMEAKLEASGSLDSFEGTTLTVLRYFDDGETTLGLFFLDGKFFCYTLEDTYRKVKIKGKTRIPSGTYNVDFNRSDTSLTLKYRKTRPWFHYHLHVKKVPGFTGIYIHSGSTHEHTEGCLLVASSITSNDSKNMIYNSKVTFEKLYKILKQKIDDGKRVRIKYFDEDFLSYSVIQNKAS